MIGFGEITDLYYYYKKETALGKMLEAWRHMRRKPSGWRRHPHYLTLLFMNRRLITWAYSGRKIRMGSGNYWFHLAAMVSKNIQAGN